MPDEHSEQNKKEGMRLTNTENDLFSSGFVLPEHRGGDGWTILHGDALDIIPHFQPGAFDAVITDPPYAGGGAKPSEKTRTTNQKYSSMSADKALPDFDGDQKDQLSWMLWTAVWMSKVRAACKPRCADLRVHRLAAAAGARLRHAVGGLDLARRGRVG